MTTGLISHAELGLTFNPEQGYCTFLSSPEGSNDTAYYHERRVSTGQIGNEKPGDIVETIIVAGIRYTFINSQLVLAEQAKELGGTEAAVSEALVKAQQNTFNDTVVEVKPAVNATINAIISRYIAQFVGSEDESMLERLANIARIEAARTADLLLQIDGLHPSNSEKIRRQLPSLPTVHTLMGLLQTQTYFERQVEMLDQTGHFTPSKDIIELFDASMTSETVGELDNATIISHLKTILSQAMLGHRLCATCVHACPEYIGGTRLVAARARLIKENTANDNT